MPLAAIEVEVSAPPASLRKPIPHGLGEKDLGAAITIEVSYRAELAAGGVEQLPAESCAVRGPIKAVIVPLCSVRMPLTYGLEMTISSRSSRSMSPARCSKRRYGPGGNGLSGLLPGIVAFRGK